MNNRTAIIGASMLGVAGLMSSLPVVAPPEQRESLVMPPRRFRGGRKAATVSRTPRSGRRSRPAPVHRFPTSRPDRPTFTARAGRQRVKRGKGRRL
jgi:hypothetical protein